MIEAHDSCRAILGALGMAEDAKPAHTPIGVNIETHVGDRSRVTGLRPENVAMVGLQPGPRQEMSPWIGLQRSTVRPRVFCVAGFERAALRKISLEMRRIYFYSL